MFKYIKFKKHSFYLRVFLVLSLPWSFPVFAIEQIPMANVGKVIQLTNKTKMADIRALPDDAMISTANGKLIPAKNFKNMADAISKIRQAGFNPTPRADLQFSRTQAAPSLQLKKGVDLKEVAKRPDSDVLQLPDGKKLTVGDLKKLSVLNQKLNGKSLLDMQTRPQRPGREGVAIKIRSKDDIQKLTGKADSTLLESPSGKKITLGELRDYAKVNGKALGEK